jgi:hypothetical protein
LGCRFRSRLLGNTSTFRFARNHFFPTVHSTFYYSFSLLLSLLLFHFHPVLPDRILFYLILLLTPSSAHDRYLNIPIIAEIQERVAKIQNDLKVHVHKTFREIGQVSAPLVTVDRLSQQCCHCRRCITLVLFPNAVIRKTLGYPVVYLSSTSFVSRISSLSLPTQIPS